MSVARGPALRGLPTCLSTCGAIAGGFTLTVVSRGQVIDVLFSVGMGTYFILTGTGIIRVCKDPAIEEKWRKKFGPFMALAGVVIIIARLFSVFGSR